jgi:hypothetical protein
MIPIGYELEERAVAVSSLPHNQIGYGTHLVSSLSLPASLSEDKMAEA